MPQVLNYEGGSICKSKNNVRYNSTITFICNPSGTLLKPEHTQNVLQLRSVLKPDRTFFILPTKKVRSGFSTERDFQNFRFSTTFWF